MRAKALAAGLLLGYCLLGMAGCSREAVPAKEPEPVEASPVSDTDSPLPTGPRTAASLVGTVVDETGAAVEHCMITIAGDSRELAIMTNSLGNFEAGLRYGPQQLTITCDPQVYQVAEATVEVPQADRFEQTFTVHKL